RDWAIDGLREASAARSEERRYRRRWRRSSQHAGAALGNARSSSTWPSQKTPIRVQSRRHSCVRSHVDGRIHPLSQTVSMPQVSPLSPRSPSPASATAVPATVRLEVRTGTSTVTSYSVGETGFLLGSVPGCDLRLPGSNLPPVLALIARQPGGASVRKLAP